MPLSTNVAAVRLLGGGGARGVGGEESCSTGYSRFDNGACCAPHTIAVAGASITLTRGSLTLISSLPSVCTNKSRPCGSGTVACQVFQSAGTFGDTRMRAQPASIISMPRRPSKIASWYAPAALTNACPPSLTPSGVSSSSTSPGYSVSSSVLEKPSSRWIPPSVSPLRKRARASTAFHQGHTLTFWSLCASTCVIGGVIVTDPAVRQFVCRTVASTRGTRSCGATPLSTASMLPSDEDRSSASPPSRRLLYSPAASFQRWALMPLTNRTCRSSSLCAAVGSPSVRSIAAKCRSRSANSALE